MMLKIIGWIPIAAVCLSICFGCGETMSPPKTANIAMSLEITGLSGTNTRDLLARAEAENKGSVAVEHDPYCGAMFIFVMQDEQGNNINFQDPTIFPECQPWELILHPGEIVRRGLIIDGRVWDEDDNEISLAPGKYTLFAYFSYSIPGSGETEHWSGEVDFHWE